jgi:hypothetical protein
MSGTVIGKERWQRFSLPRFPTSSRSKLGAKSAATRPELWPAYQGTISRVTIGGVLRPKQVSAAAAVAVFSVLGVASAVAGSATGGASVAAAEDLPIGVRLEGENRRPEYWRVELGLADRFVVDLGSRNRKLSVEVCLLHYDITDYSSDDAPCRAWTSTYTKRQLRFIAPAPGSWIVVVYGCGGCYIFRPSNASRATYEFTAHVQAYTHVSMPPSQARAGRRVTLRGVVQGAAGGKILMTRRSGRRWVPLGATRVRSDGSFYFATTFDRRGVAQIGAMYAGDERHRPSSGAATVSIR